MTTIAVSDLTQATLDGTGVFDVLMRANAAHLESEFAKGRIKGSEYSTVYLGMLTQVMQTSLQLLLSKEKTDLEAQVLSEQILQLQAQTTLITQQKANAILEGTVLVAQECKLRAEFDVLQSTNLKTVQETSLLAQKTATERAQVTTLGVDDNSVVGRQKQLYLAQTSGFTRDAEQKAAKVMVDTWNVRRTTDPDAAPADGINNLSDASVGRAVTKLLAGVGA